MLAHPAFDNKKEILQYLPFYLSYAKQKENKNATNGLASGKV